MTHKYYILIVREDGVWAPQAGDYSRATVYEELQDYLDHDYARRDLMVRCTSDNQAAINATVATLNM